MSDRLAEIRARLDAATPGPWVYPEHDLTRIQASDGISVAVITRRIDDADLIAHAPADIAWLLDRVEALETELAMSTESEVWAQVEAMRVRGEISFDGGERNA